MLVSSVITLLAIGSTSVSAANYAKFNLLKDDRDAGRLVFIPTTLAQKEIILSNVENALTVWVNYKSKIDHYGPAADPFPTIKKLRKNIKKITDEGLQLGLTDAFIMARDQHTRWTNMAPYGCFYATTGVRFAFIEGDPDIANKPTVVVTSTSEYPDLRLLFGEDYSKIQAGDELLAIDELSFVEWFEQNQFKSGAGANAFGGQRAALDYLTVIYGKFNRLPSEDSITFQFKSRANPQSSYTVNVPYVSGHDDECWNLGSKLYKSLTGITLPGTPEASLPVSAEQSGHNHEPDTTHLSPEDPKMDSPEDPKRRTDMGKRSSSSQTPVVSLNPTDVTEVSWGIYKPESANMGIIKLDSFDPEDVDTKSLAVLKAIMIIRSLLTNELKDTKSVICELRGNSGGDAEFTDNMVQLFKPDFQPFGNRYLMNQITRNLFVKGKEPNVDPFAKAWKKTKKGSRFTNVFFTNSMESANTLGQAYVRPMGVFTDGGCYSSCEVFAGAIQGHGAGAIFGEDGQTGGGGATVMDLDPSFIDDSPKYFKKFPFSQKLTSGSKTYANTLTVGVAQTIRTGLYKGQDIEDVGIKTEFIFRPQWSDLQPDPTTNTQYDRISASLDRIGQENGQSKLHFVSEPFEIETPIGKFSLEVETAGIERFAVFQADGKTIVAKKRRRSATKKRKFSIPVSAAGSTLGNNRITIVGKTAGKQVLKTNRNVSYHSN
ncbi:hypothetical protein BASA60_004542 [Batrachochytrium salamandrivorans]|nr:hypothetical protein BASA60_004542 [Batrachochytrium salamandrivorans]